ncbi:Conserved_hypothetical protein [Hexamita inflata]|uniref:Uncharacterized protein n=1 Tax=Hexamita inflata TaxID=28002 RepID=A0AA86QZC7_9EUKA|nr:Conserved hypothetical protein [Hexamita inflata]
MEKMLPDDPAVLKKLYFKQSKEKYQLQQEINLLRQQTSPSEKDAVIAELTAKVQQQQNQLSTQCEQLQTLEHLSEQMTAQLQSSQPLFTLHMGELLNLYNTDNDALQLEISARVQILLQTEQTLKQQNETLTQNFNNLLNEHESVVAQLQIQKQDSNESGVVEFMEQQLSQVETQINKQNQLISELKSELNNKQNLLQQKTINIQQLEAKIKENEMKEYIFEQMAQRIQQLENEQKKNQIKQEEQDKERYQIIGKPKTPVQITTSWAQLSPKTKNPVQYTPILKSYSNIVAQEPKQEPKQTPIKKPPTPKRKTNYTLQTNTDQKSIAQLLNEDLNNMNNILNQIKEPKYTPPPKKVSETSQVKTDAVKVQKLTPQIVKNTREQFAEAVLNSVHSHEQNNEIDMDLLLNDLLEAESHNELLMSKQLLQKFNEDAKQINKINSEEQNQQVHRSLTRAEMMTQAMQQPKNILPFQQYKLDQQNGELLQNQQQSINLITSQNKIQKEKVIVEPVKGKAALLREKMNNLKAQMNSL